MKFLYKIYSGYDGFAPARIPQRLLPSKVLRLSWSRYMDSVELGDEVWIYFHGPHAFRPGVYAKGFIQSKAPERAQANLRVREYATEAPLTDAATSERIAKAVAARGLQVFVYPEEWDIPPLCMVESSAESCANRHCGSCPTWKRLPLIKECEYCLPPRLDGNVSEFVPAYWVIPSRCYLNYEGEAITLTVRQSSNLFYRFKTGIANLAYPLALGLYKALRKRGLIDFDAVVPIPLSPDKADAGEINRTGLLAKELAMLFGTTVASVLSLNKPISKHRLRTDLGLTAKQFERQYRQALTADPGARALSRILLLDDVCTEGSTLRCAVQAIREMNADCTIVAVTAGQMILKSVVRDKAPLVA